METFLKEPTDGNKFQCKSDPDLSLVKSGIRIRDTRDPRKLCTQAPAHTR